MVFHLRRTNEVLVSSGTPELLTSRGTTDSNPWQGSGVDASPSDSKADLHQQHVVRPDPDHGPDLETPMLVGGESYEWAAIPNLDIFFARLYRYWHDKGLNCIVLNGALNIMALGFTVAFSGFLMLGVNWGALHEECIVKDTCDIWAVALNRQPLRSRGLVADLLILTYLAIFGAYWLWTVAHFAMDLRDVREAKHFVNNKLGISERRMSMMTWAEVVYRLVLLQRTTRLCMARDLDEHDIVSRIMRKDNFLIAMINKNVLSLALPRASVASARVGQRLGSGCRAAAGGAGALLAAGIRRGAGALLAAAGEGAPAAGAGTETGAVARSAVQLPTRSAAAAVATDPIAAAAVAPAGGVVAGGAAAGSAMGNGFVSVGLGNGWSHHTGTTPGLDHRHTNHTHHASGSAVQAENIEEPLLLGASGSPQLPPPQQRYSSTAGITAAAGSNRSPLRRALLPLLRAAAKVGTGSGGGAAEAEGVDKGGDSQQRGTSGSRDHRVGSSSGAATGRRFFLTKTLEWNLRWCVLDHMFDDTFCVKREFLEEPERLRRRFRAAALVNLVLSPFLLLFLLIYFFMRNAEKFYHHPGSIGSRRWSALAKWQLREFNELPHYSNHRLDAAHPCSTNYVGQFPNHAVGSVARFVAFVAGSFTALLLLVTMLDETLLERALLGRHIVWWLATLGVVLTASRSFIDDDPVAYDPEKAMTEVVAHTHWLPRHWRGRAQTAEVQAAFNALFQYKVGGWVVKVVRR